MKRSIFKIFLHTSALPLFVCFLRPSCVSHRQKVSFRWSFRIVFLWCNTTCSGNWKPSKPYKNSRFPNLLEVIAYKMATKWNKIIWSRGTYICFSVKEVVWNFFFFTAEFLNFKGKITGHSWLRILLKPELFSWLIFATTLIVLQTAMILLVFSTWFQSNRSAPGVLLWSSLIAFSD